MLLTPLKFFLCFQGVPVQNVWQSLHFYELFYRTCQLYIYIKFGRFKLICERTKLRKIHIFKPFQFIAQAIAPDKLQYVHTLGAKQINNIHDQGTFIYRNTPRLMYANSLMLVLYMTYPQPKLGKNVMISSRCSTRI